MLQIQRFLLFVFNTLLAVLLKFPVMQRITQKFAESRAPLNTDGAKPGSEISKPNSHFLVHFSDLPALFNAVKSFFSGEGLDDRQLLLEKMIADMSAAKDSTTSMKIQQFFISLLYKDLPHPPTGYVGVSAIVPAPTPARNYAFRSSDGSNYNQLYPTMGMAGSAYARSVASTNNSPKTALPDPGLVFDTLLKRDKFEKHPGGISSLFFAFADLVIHSIFNTDNKNPTINKTSSYLDLSILYGNSEKELNAIRLKDGSGKLFDDVFADYRLLMMPPAACALLVLLSRNHNYIAQRLRDINEFETYKGSFPETEAGKKERDAQDDEIFNRARLVNCGYFMKIILGDYVGAILGLVRDQSDWRLDPLMPIRGADHSFCPVGEGNVVSVEFNLLYRWHSTLSEQDAQWFNDDVFKKSFPDKNPAELTPREFVDVAHRIVREQASKEPNYWTFASLKRQGPNGTGRFADADLARILQNATDYHAGAFKARGTPEVLRVVELMAIEQSRSWGTCSMNEFRKFLGLKPYATFKEWNPDPRVHTAAAALYKDIDNLELHVGLQAEEAKIPGPGAGLCPGYTISRAILSDAVSLTRGDRFMTVDFTPHNLTAWGYQDCQYDTKDGSFGGMLTKLLFRTLPDFYPKRSVYAHFPFMQPQSMRQALESSFPDHIAKYNWLRPEPRPPTVPVFKYAGVRRVLEEPSFKTSFDAQAFSIVEPMLLKKASVFNTLRKQKPDADETARREAKDDFTTRTAALSNALFAARPPQETASLFAKKIEQLINAKSIEHIDRGTKYVDIVNDVINMLPIHWLSEEVAGFPLKTEANPHGTWYDSVTYEKFTEIAEYIYLDQDPVDDWRLREASQGTAQKGITVIKDHAESWTLGSQHPLLKKLWDEQGGKKGSTPAEFASQLFAAIVPTSTLYSQAIAHIVDFYLDEDKAPLRAKIVELVKEKRDTDKEVMVYAYEALRLRPITAGVYRTATREEPEIAAGLDGAGKAAFASLVDANTDPAVFGENANVPSYDGTTTKSVLLGYNHGFMHPVFFDGTVPAVLGAIFSHKGLKRGPKNSGKLLSFTEQVHGVQRIMYPSQRGLVSHWPESLIIEYAA